MTTTLKIRGSLQTMAVAWALATALPAQAVEQGQIGINGEVSARPLIGLTYHATQRVALRPGVFFQRVKADNAPTFIDASSTQDVALYQTDDTSFGGQLETDYFLRPQRDLAPFLAATVAYTHVNTAYPVPQASSVILKNGNLHNWSAGAAFGVQYAFTERFHVFGRLGLAYAAGQRFTVNGQKLYSHSVGTSTSALGFVFYFN
jgi:hypothetical protein